MSTERFTILDQLRALVIIGWWIIEEKIKAARSVFK